MRRKILLALIILSAIPIPQTTVPTWTVQVVNESGTPQPNVTVREAWQNYTLERVPHHEAQPTDSTGHVTFPRRVLWRPLIANAYGALRNEMHGSIAYLLASQGAAQSFTDHCCTSRLILHSLQ